MPLLFIPLILMLTVASDDFRYFVDPIDFWNSPSKPHQKNPAPSFSPQESPSPSRFEWEKYLDPNQKEFFKEGDYEPPAPFMELVKNPTDENIQNWFKLMELKNKLSDQLQVRMEEYLAKNSLPKESEVLLKKEVEKLPRASIDYKNYRFRLYFDSHCPHCERMMKTMEVLQSEGFFVELKQVDEGPFKNESGLSVSRAGSQELEEKDIRSVPVLLIGDLRKKSVYRLAGFQPPETIFETLQRQSK